jgi:hypothetical protein
MQATPSVKKCVYLKNREELIGFIGRWAYHERKLVTGIAIGGMEKALAEQTKTNNNRENITRCKWALQILKSTKFEDQYPKNVPIGVDTMLKQWEGKKTECDYYVGLTDTFNVSLTSVKKGMGVAGRVCLRARAEGQGWDAVPVGMNWLA